MGSFSGCSSPRTAQAEYPEPPVAAPAAPLQDQRIELGSISVGLAGDLPRRGSADGSDEFQPAVLHSATGLGGVASDGAHDVRACVQDLRAGQATHALAGKLVLQLEIDTAGSVLGGATDPQGGETGMAALADCVLAQARQWKFPRRTTPGSTVLIVPYRVD